MDVVLLVVGGIAELALVALSLWGASTLPPGSTVPVHAGLGGWNNWRPKKTALIAYPVIGAVVYVVLLVVTSSARSSGKTVPAVIPSIAMVVIAVTYYRALRAAARRESDHD